MLLFITVSGLRNPRHDSILTYYSNTLLNDGIITEVGNILNAMEKIRFIEVFTSHKAVRSQLLLVNRAENRISYIMRLAR